MRVGKFCVALLCLLAALPQGQCGTVLSVVLPGPASHLYNIKKVSEVLAARGHTVKYLALDHDARKLQPSSIPAFTYSILQKGRLDPAGLKIAGPQTFLRSFADIIHLFENGCNVILSNDTLMSQLKEYNADLMLAETMSPCAQVLASKLDTHFVNFWLAAPIEPYSTTLWRGSNRRAFTPNPLAYFPQLETNIGTQYMSFRERLHNFYAFWRFSWQDYTLVRPLVLKFFERFGVDPDAPSERRRFVMTLCVADFAVEWVRPLPPNFKMIGPMLPEPARPLPADLETFMEGAGDSGVLYIAMGTVATLGLKERQAMAAAFARLPVRVLWRLQKSEVPDEAALAELHLGNNTKVVDWAPQNDILGHPRTRAFMSHCGVNSLYEAAYHGVPILALPFFADQPDNADKAVAKGFALRVSHADLFTERFTGALKRVLGEPSFAAAARGISVKLRARPRTPTQEAADWVEHALATGGEAYLRTPDDDLPLFVLLSLDVWAVTLAAAALLLFIAIKAVQLTAAKYISVVTSNGAKSKAA